MDFPQNLVFHAPRQLLLLQDSLLAVPVTEFAQCYFLKIFLLVVANPLSCTRGWGGLALFPPPLAQLERSDLSRQCRVLLLPTPSTRCAQGNLWDEKKARVSGG